MPLDPDWNAAAVTPAAIGTKEAKKAGNGAYPVPSDGGPDWVAAATPSNADQINGGGVSWAPLTGQNLEGPNNAFDTTFFDTAKRQDKESRTWGMGER